MKLKMLASMAGTGFSLSIGDETDRFEGKEAQRLIDAGFAEKAPPPVVKKPNTKAEWDDERATLLDEHAKALADLDEIKAREEVLLRQVEELTVFKASVVSALGVPAAGDAIETAVAPLAPETRG